jgi:hypothetical protein
MTMRISVVTLLLALTMSTLGCASKPKPAVVTDQISAAATVTSVNQNTRELTLRTPQLGDLTVYAGPEVRNLAQVKVGDTVNVTYTQGLAAQVSDSKEARPGLTHEVVANQATEGSLPAATRGHTVSADVVIESYDPNTNVVTFRTADGHRRVLKVETPEAREFSSKLKPGDVVTITFMETLAVDVRPATPTPAP